MAQTRIFNYGDTATQAKFKQALSTLFPALVYEGCDLTVGGTSTVTMAAGSILTPGGVLVTEDASVNISLTLTAAAEDFTLVCTHADEQLLGGAGATYSAVSGFLSTYTNSTVLGWVRYPGGAIPLASSMIIPAPRGSFDVFGAIAVDYSPASFPAPFQAVISLSDPTWITSVGTYNTIPVEHIRQSITIGAGSPIFQTAFHYFQVKAKAIPPVSVTFRNNIPATLGTNIEVLVFDTAGNFVGNSVVTGTGVWQTSTYTLDTTGFTFTEGETFSVQLKVTGAAGGGDTVHIEWMDVNFNPTP